MSSAFIDRPPTPPEIERLRLILSTYQDGTGMLTEKDGRTLPGWRDFERSVALVFGGEAQESKFIFDVLLPQVNRPGVWSGLSCKMRREMNRLDKYGRVTMELSNSAGEFWNHLRSKRIDQTNYRRQPAEVGIGLIELVRSWHNRVSVEKGGMVDLNKSYYLTLSWSKTGLYQLHQFSLDLPEPTALKWSCPTKESKVGKPSRRIVGEDSSGIVFEWYGESGGQLKYYPLATAATWASERFQLEPLPRATKHGMLVKVVEYFPRLWADASSDGL